MTNTTINNKITRNDNDLLTICDIIVHKALRVIVSRSHNAASSADKILRNRNRYATEYDDLMQDVALTILDNDIQVMIALDNNNQQTRQLMFDTDDNKRKTYQTVQTKLLLIKHRHAKRQYVERYLDELDENGNNLMEIVLYTKSEQEYDRQQSEFEIKTMIEDIKPQLTPLQKHTLDLLLQGYGVVEISHIDSVSHQSVTERISGIQRVIKRLYGDTFTQNISNLMHKDTQSKRNTSRRELRYSEK